MYKKDFDLLLRKKIPQLVFLYGESTFYIDFYINKILLSFSSSALYRFYFSEFNLVETLDILSSRSLFGDKTVVVLKLDSKFSKRESGELIQALENNPLNHLIVGFYPSDMELFSQYIQDARAMSYLLKSPIGVEVRFFHPTLSESLSLLRDRCKALNLQCTDDALNFLFELQNQNLGIACSELDKLATYSNHLTLEDLQRFSFGFGSMSFAKFLEIFFQSNDFLLCYERMMEEGFESIELLRGFERHFSILFLFFTYMKVYNKWNVREILGYIPPQHVVDNYIQNASILSEGKFQKIFETLVYWRNGIFSGRFGIDIQCLVQLKSIFMIKS